jgi:hypothetical protein
MRLTPLCVWNLGESSHYFLLLFFSFAPLGLVADGCSRATCPDLRLSRYYQRPVVHPHKLGHIPQKGTFRLKRINESLFDQWAIHFCAGLCVYHGSLSAIDGGTTISYTSGAQLPGVVALRRHFLLAQPGQKKKLRCLP